MKKTGSRRLSSRLIASRPITVAEHYHLRLPRGDLLQLSGNREYGHRDNKDYSNPSSYFDQVTAIAKPHPFRETLPISALTVTIEPGLENKTTVHDDIRMFVLSFVTFFMGISLFIW